MFDKPEVLDKNKHEALKFTADNSFHFAAGEHVAPLIVSEVVKASRAFAVVFPVSGALNLNAVLSLQKGKNHFVSADGQWLAPMIPAHFRRYPFLLGKVKEHEYAMMFDSAAPQFSSEDGELLFESDGDGDLKMSKRLQIAKDFLIDLQRQHEATRKLLAPLEEKGVLVQQKLTVGRGDEKKDIRGFRIVSTKKLAALDDATLAAWTRSGLMGIIFAHLHSLENVKLLAGDVFAAEMPLATQVN